MSTEAYPSIIECLDVYVCSWCHAHEHAVVRLSLKSTLWLSPCHYPLRRLHPKGDRGSSAAAAKVVGVVGICMVSDLITALRTHTAFLFRLVPAHPTQIVSCGVARRSIVSRYVKHGLGQSTFETCSIRGVTHCRARQVKLMAP